MKRLLARALAAIIVAVFLASIAIIPMDTASASKATIAGPIQGLTHLKQGNYPLLSNDEPSGYDASPFLDERGARGRGCVSSSTLSMDSGCLDDFLGGFYYQDFISVLNGTHCNIWVGLNDTVWTGGYTMMEDERTRICRRRVLLCGAMELYISFVCWVVTRMGTVTT